MTEKYDPSDMLNTRYSDADIQKIIMTALNLVMSNIENSEDTIQALSTLALSMTQYNQMQEQRFIAYVYPEMEHTYALLPKTYKSIIGKENQ